MQEGNGLTQKFTNNTKIFASFPVTSLQCLSRYEPFFVVYKMEVNSTCKFAFSVHFTYINNTLSVFFLMNLFFEYIYI